MSLDLVDVKFKIPAVTLAILKGKAKAKGIHVADIMRALADKEADEFRVALSEAERVLAAQGLAGELRGPTGRFAMHADGVLDLDDQEA